jgi:hypothetical protein
MNCGNVFKRFLADLPMWHDRLGSNQDCLVVLYLAQWTWYFADAKSTECFLLCKMALRSVATSSDRILLEYHKAYLVWKHDRNIQWWLWLCELNLIYVYWVAWGCITILAHPINFIIVQGCAIGSTFYIMLGSILKTLLVLFLRICARH